MSKSEPVPETPQITEGSVVKEFFSRLDSLEEFVNNIPDTIIVKPNMKYFINLWKDNVKGWKGMVE